MNAQKARFVHNLHVTTFKHKADSGQVLWTEAPVPEGKEGAMRAFQGQSGSYLVLVTQANMVATGELPGGVQHFAMGTVTQNSAIMTLHFTPDEANTLYHQAATGRN